MEYCNGTSWVSFPHEASCSLGSWTASAAAEANVWVDVTYGNGLFVAVAQSGTNRVMTSPDGITWTPRTAAEANQWRSVTYGNGLFVAVAQTGTNRVMTSPDGITWTPRTAAEASGWQSVTYGNGLFVAVDYSGTDQVMTSPDGITWTSRTEAEPNGWTSVTFGSGLFVAVANTGTNRVMTSPDGITWTPRAAAEANLWASVTYGNGLFVAVSGDGANRVMTSPDGITWTPRTAAEANGWRFVAYGNGLFVAVAYDGTNRVMTSPDGITWTPGAAAEANSWMGVTYSSGLFVAVSADGANRVMTAECLSAGCSDPTHPAGTMLYNSDHRVMQWCDGTNWQAAGMSPGMGPNAGCTAPSQPGGFMMFNQDYCVMQYCDGDTWRRIGVAVPDPCACNGGAAPGLVGFWKFDEGSGTTTADSSSNGNTGTLLTPNGPAWTASGKINGGLILDAANDYVTVPHSASLNMTNAMTIALWFKPADLDSRDHDLVTKGTNTPIDRATFGLALRGTAIVFGFCTGANSACAANWNEARTVSLSMTVGAWHHIAVTFNDVATNEFWFYLDGVQYALSNSVGAPFTKSMVAFTDPVRIGEVFDGEETNATVDDVRIYNRVLSPTEIAQLHSIGNSCE